MFYPLNYKGLHLVSVFCFRNHLSASTIYGELFRKLPFYPLNYRTSNLFSPVFYRLLRHLIGMR